MHRSSPRLDITVATMPPPRSRPARAPGARDQRQDLVAVDQLAALVGQQQPVGVAVERDAEIGAVLHHLAHRKSGTVEPQPRLMLNPSGDTPTGTTVAPSSHSTVGRDPVGGAVGAVDHDAAAHPAAARAGRSPWPPRCSGRRVVEPRRAAQHRRLGEVGPTDPRPSAPRSRLSASSDSLKPSGPNSLMPLSSNGLCEAEIITPRSARRLRVSIATAGVGSGPTRVTSMPAPMKPGGQRRLDHVARQSRVLADHHPMAMGAAGEHQPGGLAEPQRGLGGHRVGVGRAADAVGAEQAPGVGHCRSLLRMDRDCR